MKCQVPQISWHGRDPVLSIDFQPNKTDVFRLASGGTDSHVLIWYITYEENKTVKIECASDLYRHNKSVNVVRFSPSGEFLASGDDEGTMFIWELREREQMIDPPNEDENPNKEYWYPVKLLRGHLDDIYDICWSRDGNFLVSSSMDNTVIVWDMQKYVKSHIFSDFKGYVQGVCWDPCNQYIASVGSDRTLRIHNINSKKNVCKISKAPWTNSTEKGTFKARLFFDDTLQSYFRRLSFTPDGELLIVPSGIIEKGEKVTNSCYVFSRHVLNKPALSLPTGEKYTVAVKCNPFLYKLRKSNDDTSNKENETFKPMINLPYRMIFAVAACDSVLFYDTEQLLPFAYVSNIHYTHLTDLSWSPDGLTLVVSSTDGYCSFILFTMEELGEIYIPEKPKETEIEPVQIMETDTSQTDVNFVTNCALQQPDCPPNEGNKSVSAPNTPKNMLSASAKSPKSNSIPKEENVTPSSKCGKNVIDNKKSGKKSPKMMSIKKFFISPKTVQSPPCKSDKNPVQSLTKNDTVKKETDVIVLSDSPMKVQKTGPESVDNSQQLNALAENLKSYAKAEIEGEAMDIDDICPKNEQKSPTGRGKQSKCKVRLEFAENLVAEIDDNASDSNPLASESAQDVTDPKKIENENDWKLELSQDEEITLMEVTPVVTDVEMPKSINFSDTKKDFEFKVPESTNIQLKNQESKPKRRIPFVTLSSSKQMSKK